MTYWLAASGNTKIVAPTPDLALSMEELRAEGKCSILMPGQALDSLRCKGPINLSPLCGGVRLTTPGEAWICSLVVSCRKWPEPPGKDGLVHISQIAHERVENVNDYLKEGEEVQVKVLDVDQRGRIKLSIKELTEKVEVAEVEEASEDSADD